MSERSQTQQQQQHVITMKKKKVNVGGPGSTFKEVVEFDSSSSQQLSLPWIPTIENTVVLSGSGSGSGSSPAVISQAGIPPGDSQGVYCETSTSLNSHSTTRLNVYAVQEQDTKGGPNSIYVREVTQTTTTSRHSSKCCVIL